MTAHCTCGRTWNSLVECHCTVPGCHRHFSNVTAFDRHRPTRGGCPDPATLTDTNGDPLLTAIDRPGGTVWVRWVSEADRTAMRDRLAAAKDSNAGSRSRPRSDEQAEPVSLEG